jgi:hypothetical protein
VVLRLQAGTTRRIERLDASWFEFNDVALTESQARTSHISELLAELPNLESVVVGVRKDKLFRQRYVYVRDGSVTIAGIVRDSQSHSPCIPTPHTVSSGTLAKMDLQD